MKKRLLCTLLCACLTLSGCTSMLSRDLVSITPHKSTTTDAGSSSALRVETYQELVNSLSYLISSGAAEGVIRLYMQTPQAEDDLSAGISEALRPRWRLEDSRRSKEHAVLHRLLVPLDGEVRS